MNDAGEQARADARARSRRATLAPGATRDGSVILQARALRALGDGLVSVVFAAYLTTVGLSQTEIGFVIAVTMIGSAALTIFVGFRAASYPRGRLLRLLSILMVVTGLGFAAFTSLWPLALVALVGTLNPTGGDISAFQPTEQAVLPSTVDDRGRTALFARYGLIGTMLTAIGAALAGVPDLVAEHTELSDEASLRWSFVAYAALGVLVLERYRQLGPGIEPDPGRRPTGLGESRRTVHRLAALFSLDSFGGGFTITAIVVLWLQQRFDLSLAVSGVVFFWAGLLAAWSQLLAPRLARRIGLVRTMALTHLPANGFLVLAAFMPNAPLAIACLLCRAALSQMDIPARSSYVMAVVRPEERAAAATITSVPRSLVAAVPPALAGWLLSRTDFGWPLVIGGCLKALYDLLLLQQFRHVRPPEEENLSREGSA